MHVIRDKSTQQTLYIDYRETAELLPGEAVYSTFNAATMEVGWTSERYVPAFYDIDKTGVIVELPLEEAARRGWHRLSPTEKLVDGKIIAKSDEQLLAEGKIDFNATKAQMIEMHSQMAFALRAKLIPDHKLQNAVLGVYDDDRLPAYRATIAAFREEFHRLEDVVQKAKTLQDLRAIMPNFPDSIVFTPVVSESGPAVPDKEVVVRGKKVRGEIDKP